MQFWWRTLRLLLIGGLIPLVAAAGLPLQACGCGQEGEADASCPCCAASIGEECCCCRFASRGEGGRRSSDEQATLTCRCCGDVSAPAIPCPPPIDRMAEVQTSAPFSAPIPRLPLPRSTERARSALLPAPDLPTMLCSLLI